MVAPKDQNVSECELGVYIGLQTYRYRFDGRLCVRYVSGGRVTVASEVDPNFVVPSTVAYFIDFSDDAPAMNEWVSNGDNKE